MPRVPSLTSKQLLRALQRAGFAVSHQTGSHVHLKNPAGVRVTVPFHARTLHKGTLHAVIKQAGLSHEEFIKLL